MSRSRSRALLLASLIAAALVATSGVAWAAKISCPNRDGNLCVGTGKKDTMTGREGRADEMRGRGGPDQMRGRGGADVMLGQLGNDAVSGQLGPDKITGGGGADDLVGGAGKDALAGVEGADTLTGAEGDDALKGGGGADQYVFRVNAWGDDTITDTADTDNDPLTASNFAEFGFPDALTTRLTIDLTSRANSPEVRNGTLTGTVNWENDAIDGVYVGSIADDTVIGNAAANELNVIGGEDSDTVRGEAGNDRISVLDGDGGDVVDCGAGEDQVFVDAGDTISGCERQNNQ